MVARPAAGRARGRVLRRDGQGAWCGRGKKEVKEKGKEEKKEAAGFFIQSLPSAGSAYFKKNALPSSRSGALDKVLFFLKLFAEC
jgi:hypothetical protein